MDNVVLNKMESALLKSIADIPDLFAIGAFSLRKNGQPVQVKTTPNINILPKGDTPGIDIYVRADTNHETVYIPVVVTEGGVDDKVYNDFYIGKNADVVIVAGCGTLEQRNLEPHFKYEIARHSRTDAHDQRLARPITTLYYHAPRKDRRPAPHIVRAGRRGPRKPASAGKMPEFVALARRTGRFRGGHGDARSPEPTNQDSPTR